MVAPSSFHSRIQTHDNLDGDTHQAIHQVNHQDSTSSAVILHLIPPFPICPKTEKTISLLTEKEVDERFIKKIVGHKGQGVTENVYTHIELPTKLEAINLI